jgi:hypothetical protein
LFGEDDALDAERLEVERGRRHVPAAVQFAHQVLARDADVVHEHLVEVVGAEHVREPADRDAGRLHVHQEVGDAAVLRRIGVGASEKDAVVRAVRVRRPDLLAVDHEVVAVLHRARL